MREKGITLIALVVTIIVILILSGIGIGLGSQTKKDLKETDDAILKSELSKIQQAILETYIKYNQNGASRILKGTPISYAEAKAIEAEIQEIDSNISLRGSSYTLGEGDPGNEYYTLNKTQLAEMGIITKTEDDIQYMVNYSTGEVFDKTNKQTSKGEALYIFAK